MAKDRPTETAKAEKKEKKKDKKRSEEDGVSKPKDKADKKEKKAKREALAEKALSEINTAAADVEVIKSDDEDDDKGKGKKTMKPVGALVPFANPLADEKVAKKVFKSVKKAAAHRTLKRGVKEVVKALRKSPTAPSGTPTGVIVLAADISPMDVISHIPVLCEDHDVPYIYVTSRAELGMAGQTKRPTSVVMVIAKAQLRKGKDGKVEEADKEKEGEWEETYKGLIKTVQREGKHVIV